MTKLTNSEMVWQLQDQMTTLRTEFNGLQIEIQNFEIQLLRERVAILEVEITELKRLKQESEKRHWQFVYIFSGGMVTLFVSLLVQLIVSMIRK